MQPKISIIIPMWGVEKYLRRCLDSVKNQTFQDWTAICVDDGSPDKSGDIAEE
jgi:glycosyltransferase involved in cell wall biosynthesis